MLMRTFQWCREGRSLATPLRICQRCWNSIDFCNNQSIFGKFWWIFGQLTLFISWMDRLLNQNRFETCKIFVQKTYTQNIWSDVKCSKSFHLIVSSLTVHVRNYDLIVVIVGLRWKFSPSFSAIHSYLSPHLMLTLTPHYLYVQFEFNLLYQIIYVDIIIQVILTIFF